MEISETGKIMEVLSAFYGQGKSDVEKMLLAWNEILKDYKYNVVYQAVMTFARNDKREYASFPAPGAIIKVIEDAQADRKVLANKVFNNLYNGVPYKELPPSQQEVCPEDVYQRGLELAPESLLEKQEDFKDMIRTAQRRLEG